MRAAGTWLYFLELAERAGAEIYGPQQAEWIDRLEREHDNFQAALDWCATSHQTEAALRLLVSLGWSWSVRSHYSETSHWFSKISELPDIAEYPALYAALLNHLGKQHWLTGEFGAARAIFEESEAIWLQLGDAGELGLAETWDRLGLVARWGEGDNSTAQRLFEQSHALYQKRGDQRGIAESLFHLAILEDDRNQDAAALAMYTRCLDLFEQSGDLWGIARVSQLIGQFNLKTQHYEKARSFFDQHLAIDEELQFIEGIVVALRNLGNLYRYQGQDTHAEQYYEKSLLICREHDLKDDLSKNLYCMGLLSLHRNEYTQAARHFLRYFDIARSVNEKKSICDLLMGMAAVAGGLGQFERAARLSGAAQAALAEIDLPYSPFDQAEFDRHIAFAQDQLGENAFDALANEGQRLPSEQAVAYALEVDGIGNG
jgi:tetratricopeptide (TPR) repeat protein